MHHKVQVMPRTITGIVGVADVLVAINLCPRLAQRRRDAVVSQVQVELVGGW